MPRYLGALGSTSTSLHLLELKQALALETTG